MPQHQAILIYLLFILVLSFAAVAYSQLPPHPVEFIPTLYVTDQPESPKPSTVVMYVADICNTKVYAGYMTIVRVNMPNGWNPFIGLLAKLEVCTSSACDHIICTNFVNGVFNGQHNCSFAYNTTYDHIYVRVTSGDAPNIAWTIGLEFTTRKGKVLRNKLTKKYVYLREPKARNQISPNDTKPLAQFVHLLDPQVVGTMNRRDFSFSLCPDSWTTQR